MTGADNRHPEAPARPIVMIPARLASTRLPDKPLADIHGAPMIVHVWRRAVEAGLGPVVVACAEEAIAAAFGSVEIVAAAINVVPSHQMLCSVGFIVTMDPLRCRVPLKAGRGDYPDLMDTDQPVVLDVLPRGQQGKVTLKDFTQERAVDGLGSQWSKASVLAAVERIDSSALKERGARDVG